MKLRKALTFILALVLCIGLLPMSAFAAEKKETASKPVESRAVDGAIQFSSDEPFTLRTRLHVKYWNGTIEYSYGEERWKVWNGTSTLQSRSVNGREVLYLRGFGNTVISYNLNGTWMISGNNVACKGNIENLLDYRTVAAGEHPEMGERCFRELFNRCMALTVAPELPAETLAPYCYYRMFCLCRNLLKAPELPALELKPHCYEGMFLDCSSLRKAPELNALVMEPYCYSQMFAGCTAITSVQAELPSIKLAEACYRAMFGGCAITTAPKLPATKLESCCYERMFYRCPNLVAPPALPATDLAVGCYFYMFDSCGNLTSLPALPATYLPKNCYYGMFTLCTKIMLSEEPGGAYATPYAVPFDEEASYVGNSALKYMFKGTGGTFTGTPQVNTTYYLHKSNSIVY